MFVKAANKIMLDALSDVNADVSGTSSVSGFSAASFTGSQQTAIWNAAYEAMYDVIAEIVTGKSSFDGFRLSEINPVTIYDHENSETVSHTPNYVVSDGVLTLNTTNSEINRSELQKALNLEDGAKGLIIEVELGTLPSSAQTIEFKGILIDGNDSSVDIGERGIDIRFQVLN